jgi:hypothetical protein
MTESLRTVAGVAGLAGIAMLLFYLLFREVIRKAIFPQLSKQQAYRLMGLIVCLISGVTVAAMIIWKWPTDTELSRQQSVDLEPLQLVGNTNVLRTEVDVFSRITSVPGQIHCPAKITYGVAGLFETFEPDAKKEIIITGKPRTKVPIKIEFTGGPPAGQTWTCHGTFSVKGP